MRIFRIFILCLSILLATSIPGSTQSSGFSFATPPRLRARVDFWKGVFTKYGRHSTLLHHRNFPQIVFDVVDLSLEGALLNPIQFDNLKNQRVERAVKAVKAALSYLANGSSPRTRLERNIAAQMEKVLGKGEEKYRLVLKDDLVRTQTGIREKFRDSVRRSGKYLARMEEIFKSHGLPIELTRLPFIESSFDYTAYSTVGAAGIWQFMRRTALNYMTVNHIVDQRRDPIISTHAAARYLKEAYRALGNWPQAITSYNHGVGGVRRKMTTSGLSSIADLIEHPTRNSFGFASTNFYPEFLAAVEVYRDYKRYFPGLVVDREERYVERKLSSSMNINTIARVYGYSIEKLKTVNYSFSKAVWLGRSTLPRGYTVKLPVGDTGNVAIGSPDSRETLATIEELKTPIPYSIVKASPVLHIVRRGESLSTIAKHYGVSVKEILKSNGLTRAIIYRGQKIKIPGKVIQGNLGKSKTSNTLIKPSAAPIRYVVRRGDTILAIANRHKMSVAQLKSLNGIKSNRIFVGQSLKLTSVNPVVNNSRTVSSPTYHTVSSGDTVWAISKRYGVSQQQIFRLNGVRAKQLRRGQKLRIR